MMESDLSVLRTKGKGTAYKSYFTVRDDAHVVDLSMDDTVIYPGLQYVREGFDTEKLSTRDPSGFEADDIKQVLTDIDRYVAKVDCKMSEKEKVSMINNLASKVQKGFSAEVLVAQWKKWKENDIRVVLLKGDLSNGDALLVWSDMSTIIAEIKYVPYGTWKNPSSQKFIDYGRDYLTVPVKVNKYFYSLTPRGAWCLIIVIGHVRGLSMFVWIIPRGGTNACIPGGVGDHIGVPWDELIHIGDIDNTPVSTDLVSKCLVDSIYQRTIRSVFLCPLTVGFTTREERRSGYMEDIITSPTQVQWHKPRDQQETVQHRHKGGIKGNHTKALTNQMLQRGISHRKPSTFKRRDRSHIEYLPHIGYMPHIGYTHHDGYVVSYEHAWMNGYSYNMFGDW